MFLSIEIESEEPIYRQLMKQLLCGIAHGELQPGEQLASVRQLASDLGINMHTVNKAYTLLKQYGYLVSNRQKGMTVASEIPQANDIFKQKLREILEDALCEAACRNMNKNEVMALCEEVYNDLSGGEK